MVGKPQVPEMRIRIGYDLGRYSRRDEPGGTATYTALVGNQHSPAPECASVPSEAREAPAHTTAIGGMRVEVRQATSLSPGVALNLRALWRRPRMAGARGPSEGGGSGYLSLNRPISRNTYTTN